MADDRVEADRQDTNVSDRKFGHLDFFFNFFGMTRLNTLASKQGSRGKKEQITKYQDNRVNVRKIVLKQQHKQC